VICVVDCEFLHEDIYAAVGTNVTLQCHSTDSKPVRWQYRNFVETNASDVFDGQVHITDYVNKSVNCTINNLTYDLTIVEVKVDDTGEYWCVENEGFGVKHVTKLFVTGV